MNPRSERAVSTMVSYVLVLGISALLVTGLLLATTGYVTDQRQLTVQEGLEVVGQQIATDLVSADRTVQASEGAGGGPTVRVTHELPPSLAGVGYSIEVTSGPPAVITLTAHERDVSAEVRVWTETSVAPSTLTSGRIAVRYDAGGDVLVVENA